MLRLRDIMTADVVTLHPDDTLRDAITLLSERSITGAPVVNGEMVVGVISMMDVMDMAANAGRVVAGNRDDDEDDWQDAEVDARSNYYTEAWVDELSGFDEGEEIHDVLEDHTVEEAMTRRLLLLPPDTEIHAAAEFMLEHGVHRVLVASDGRLEGLVSTTDFLRLIAQRRL